MNSFFNNYYQYYKPYTTKFSHDNAYSKTSNKSTIETPKNNLDTTKDNNNTNKNSKNISNTDNNINSRNLSNGDKSSKYFSFGPIGFKNPFFTDIEEPIFEIFGIELYLDDIIILGLLFFLYQENVQDEMLFVVLILLLIN